MAGRVARAAASGVRSGCYDGGVAASVSESRRGLGAGRGTKDRLRRGSPLCLVPRAVQRGSGAGLRVQQ